MASAHKSAEKAIRIISKPRAVTTTTVLTIMILELRYSVSVEARRQECVSQQELLPQQEDHWNCGGDALILLNENRCAQCHSELSGAISLPKLSLRHRNTATTRGWDFTRLGAKAKFSGGRPLKMPNSFRNLGTNYNFFKISCPSF